MNSRFFPGPWNEVHWSFFLQCALAGDHIKCRTCVRSHWSTTFTHLFFCFIFMSLCLYSSLPFPLWARARHGTRINTLYSSVRLFRSVFCLLSSWVLLLFFLIWAECAPTGAHSTQALFCTISTPTDADPGESFVLNSKHRRHQLSASSPFWYGLFKTMHLFPHNFCLLC